MTQKINTAFKYVTVLIGFLVLWGMWHSYAPTSALRPWCDKEGEWERRYLGADLSPEFMKRFIGTMASWYPVDRQLGSSFNAPIIVSGRRIYMSAADLESSSVLNFMLKMPSGYASSMRDKSPSLAKLYEEWTALEAEPGDRWDKKAQFGDINCRILEIMLK